MATPPSIDFYEFAPSGVDPVGQRHVTTHGSFVKQVGSAAGQLLDFGQLNTTFEKKTTETKAIVAVPTSFGDATEAIFNLRFWLPDIGDFTKGTFHLNGFPSGTWISGIAVDGLNDASGVFIPTALPSGFNLRRQDGWPEISGVNSDVQVTEYIYLSVGFDTDVPPKVYGGSSGGFVYRLTFDYK